MNARVLMYLVGSVVILTLLFLFMGGDTVITTTTPSLEIATRTVTSSIRFWLLYLASGLILVIWTWVKYDYKNGVSRTERLLNARPPAWSFAVLLGTVTFHWLFWAVNPESWSTWLQSQRFWPMNVAIILAMFFIAQRNGIVRFIGLGLGICVLLVVTGFYPRVKTPSPADLSAYQKQLPYHQGRWNLPADVILPIIAQCESGGRQFDDKGNVIVSPTQDYGKWQINLPIHGKEINRRAINIWTEEGNEQFARILYGRNELSDWQATRHCWEPKLLALGGLPDGERTFIVTVGPEWSKVYRYQGSMTVDHRAIGPQKRIAMMTESGVYHFTPEKSDFVPNPVNWARFKSLTDSDENVRVTLSR